MVETAITFMIPLFISFVYLLITSIIDIKTREVPDGFSFSLMGIGITYNLMLSLILFDSAPIVASLISFIIFFGIGYLLYSLNVWGGGDTKILGGLALLFGFTGYQSFIVAFFINIFLIGAFYGLLISVGYAIKFRKKLKYEKIKHINLILSSSLIIILISYFLIGDFEIMLLFNLLILCMVFSIYLTNFMKTVQKSMLEKKVTISKLTEGDWIVDDIIVDGKKIALKKENGLTIKQISKLKNLCDQKKIKKVLIKEGLPFLPCFLISLIMTYLFGNLFMLIITLF